MDACWQVLALLRLTEPRSGNATDRASARRSAWQRWLVRVMQPRWGWEIFLGTITQDSPALRVNGARVCDSQQLRQSGDVRIQWMHTGKFRRCCGSQTRAPLKCGDELRRELAAPVEEVAPRLVDDRQLLTAGIFRKRSLSNCTKKSHTSKTTGRVP